MLRIERYGKGKYWALYDGQELVAVTVYKRGAQEVVRRLEAAHQAQDTGTARPPCPPPARTDRQGRGATGRSRCHG
jgi:hypothetical protein